jgi:hypothetical protein
MDFALRSESTAFLKTVLLSRTRATLGIFN